MPQLPRLGARCVSHQLDEREKEVLRQALQRPLGRVAQVSLEDVLHEREQLLGVRLGVDRGEERDQLNGGRKSFNVGGGEDKPAHGVVCAERVSEGSMP